MTRLASAFPPRTLTNMNLFINDKTVTLQVLTDSEADKDLMNWTLAKQLQVKTFSLDLPVWENALDIYCLQLSTRQNQSK